MDSGCCCYRWAGGVGDMEVGVSNDELLPCPFCGKRIDANDPDTLYPAGIYWRDDPDFGRLYVSHLERLPTDNNCYRITCNNSCGAEIIGDSIEEVISKWNTRGRMKLLITQCPDPLMWYAGMIGEYVPYLGEWPEGYKSQEPAGYINIVRFEDAILGEE